jgi:tol-pal system protein YbgF
LLTSRLAFAALAVGLAGAPVLAQESGLPRALSAAGAAANAARSDLQLAQADPAAARVAALELRLSRLEEELRGMTGRLEELEFAQRRSDERLDKLIVDLDARLARLEGSAAPATASTGAARANPLAVDEAEPALPPALPDADAEPPRHAARQTPMAEPPPAVGTTARRPGAPLPEEDPAARQGYVLGTLPRDAIMGGGAGAQQQAAIPGPTRNVPNTPKARYDDAIALLQGGDFLTARREFSSFVEDYPNDMLTPSAAYWLAETHYVTRDYQTAAALFARNYQTYGPQATKAPDNLLKMAMALAQLGQSAEACQAFSELEGRHPNAPAPIKQAALRGKTQAGCS